MENIPITLLILSAFLIGCESSLGRNASAQIAKFCHEGARWMDKCNICSCVNGLPLCSHVTCEHTRHRRSIRDSACLCEPLGSVSSVCDENGNCKCRPNFVGKYCDNCIPGHGGYKCEACDCDPRGSLSTNCDENNKCDCRPNFTGQKCDRCAIAHGGPHCEGA